MDNRKIVKQLIDFHKTSFEKCFSLMVTLQQQAENIFNFFHYIPIMSDEGKKFMKQRTDAYKKWIDDLKKAMDEGYAKLEEFYDNKAIDMLQDKTKKALNSYLSQENWTSPGLKKLLKELDATYKKGCDDFKKYVDDNIQSLKNYYGNVHKSQTKNRKKN